MENNNLNQPTNNPIEAPVQPQIQPVSNFSLKRKSILLPIIGVILLLIIVGGGFYILGQRNPLNPSTQNNAQPTISPQANNVQNPINNSSNPVVKSNQIRVFGVILTYLEQWIPIFGKPNESKSVVYLAKTTQEAQGLLNCASQGSCTNSPLKLEDFGNVAVWQTHTIEAFIGEVRKDINLNQLQKTTLNGREAWLGYTDSSKLTHQAVISTGTSQAKSFVAIKATATDKQMMEEYVSRLPSMIVNEYKDTKPKELSIKKGYTIDITSSLVTEDYFQLSFILDSLLAPNNSTKTYHYSLYNETKHTSGSNNPQGNFLNSKYYLLTDNDQLRDGVYSTPQVQIKLATSNVNNLGAYLADPKYCQQDSDCQHRSNFCTIDAFNGYHQFYTPWGCGAPDYGSLGNYTDLQSQLNCSTDIEVKYDSLKCVNNSCQAINAKPVCKQ